MLYDTANVGKTSTNLALYSDGGGVLNLHSPVLIFYTTGATVGRVGRIFNKTAGTSWFALDAEL